MRIAGLWVGAALACGCSDGQVTVQGVVASERGTGRPPLGGASITLRDADGTVVDSGVTGADGAFSLVAPAGITMHAEVSAPGFATTSFTGVSGLNTEMMVEDGALYVVRTTEIEDWRARFAGCPGLDAEGGAYIGEVRVFDLQDSATGEHPEVTSASVRVSDADGENAWKACYLDEAGSAWDPEATVTGASGVFAVFGVPSGLHTIIVDYAVPNQSAVTAYYDTWMPALGMPGAGSTGGADTDTVEQNPGSGEATGVSGAGTGVPLVPRFPLYVEFPF